MNFFSYVWKRWSFFKLSINVFTISINILYTYIYKYKYLHSGAATDANSLVYLMNISFNFLLTTVCCCFIGTYELTLLP